MEDKLVLLRNDQPAVVSFESSIRENPGVQPASTFHFPHFHLSIKRRLPLLIGILLSGMLVASTWAAYRGVQAAALEVGQERLRFLTQQLATIFQQSFQNAGNKTVAAASEPAVLAALLAPPTHSVAEVTAALRQFLPPQDVSSLRVELWNAQRVLVQALPESSAPIAAGLDTEFNQVTSGPVSYTVGAMRLSKETTAYPIVAAIKNATGQPRGYLVRWRKVAATAEARQQFVDLLGSQTAFYLGNQQGELWSDLVKVASKPPVEMRFTSAITQYAREDNHSVMALARSIHGTPWVLLVEFPHQPIFAQARSFLRRMSVMGVMLLVIGLSVAMVMSYSITQPLDSLTKAAVAVANGDYSRLVSLRSQDELGVLAQTFNAMAVQVKDAQRELELKVQDRTLQLQAANKELEAFSYSVSHDLRAPLRHINGFSQALLEDHADQLDATGKGYLQEVRGASQEMAQLIDDLLQLARVTRSELRREPVNLSQLAQEVLVGLQKSGGERTVISKIEEGLEAEVDQGLLRVVLTNLLGNAWKFTAQKEPAEIVFGQEKQAGAPIYFVRDNGAGFEMAYANKLFGAFQRLHSAGEFEGTGIGLATVQRVIHRHGGRVWAVGAVNQGATFYFTLPNFKAQNKGD